MKQFFALIGMVVLFAFSASAAFAGEITGNGKWIVGDPALPLNGNSICAYSGQNDEFQLGVAGAARVQSFGQDNSASVQAGDGSLGGVPGTACNPSPQAHHNQ
jgi:hypothetical protein